METPDFKCFGWCYGDPQHADVRIHVCLRDGNACSKASPGAAGHDIVRLELPSHAIVLSEASAWARTALDERWTSQQHADGQPSILRMVIEDDSEVEAPALLLAAMYHHDGAAALTDATQLQLLQVLQLSDRFAAPRCADAASRLLCSVPPNQIDWDALAAVWRFPLAYRDDSAAPTAFRHVLQWARDAVQVMFGDLEAAMQDKEARRKLVALPFEALMALLLDVGVAVESENTCYCAAAEWLHAQPGNGTPEQRAALAESLRLPHLTPAMLATAAARCAWLSSHFTAAELLAASFIASHPSLRRDDLLFCCGQPAASHPAWRLPPRRRPSNSGALRGCCGGAELGMVVRAEQLRALHDAAASGAAACAGGADGGDGARHVTKAWIRGPRTRVNGWAVYLQLQANAAVASCKPLSSSGNSSSSSGSSSGNGASRDVRVSFGLYVRTELPEALRVVMRGAAAPCGDMGAGGDAAMAEGGDGSGARCDAGGIGKVAGCAPVELGVCGSCSGGSGQPSKAAAPALRPVAVCCADAVQLMAYEGATWASPASLPDGGRRAGAAGANGGQAAPADAPAIVRRVDLGPACFSEESGWGMAGFFGVDPAPRWWDERPWREAGLLGADGKMRVGAVVVGLG